MTSRLRLPNSALWLLLVLASAAGLHYAWRTFPKAFSIISLDLTMDRGLALARADSLARVRGWKPAADSARSAASFDLDFDAQTFVELDGGGPAVFQQLIRDGRFAPYTWQVRRFAPGEVRETEVRFTPSGEPYGFREKIPEAEPGAALPRDSALALARAEARRWEPRFDQFALVESVQERRASGRVDHTFAWERAGAGIGEGQLRLKVVVAGDRPVEVKHFLQVPEAFTRRYANLRTANEAISTAAMVAMLLYGVFGVGGGLFLMMRRKAVLWRPALIAGGAVALLQLGALVSSMPLAWIGYDTAVPVQSWLATLAFGGILATVSTVLMVGLTAAAAEALTRRAFPGHPQLWQLWSKEGGSSTTVAGATVAAYLLIGLDLAWIVWFARTTNQWQGWWNPSDILAQPNLLATWLPWLGPVALAAQAGFWEECLFRAVPLAGAALLGERYGRRGLWLTAAMVLQVLVFAAGHANYPTQPSYSRVLELILPSLVFGLVYLRLGLMPAVVMHFGYDLALMSIPVFVSRAPGSWISQAMVLAAGLLPLGTIVWRTAQRGGLGTLPERLRNRGWEGGAEGPEVPVPAATPTPGLIGTRPGLVWWLYPLAIAGLVIWIGTSASSAPSPRLRISRADAIRLAQDTLAGRGIRLGPEWRTLASVYSGSDPERTMVWRTAGDSTYRSLFGSHLAAPHWGIRFARFEGDLAERAEEWRVSVQGTGQVTGVEHQLPEARSGASLSDSAARRVADSALVAAGADPSGLALVALEPNRRAARTDWTVTYRDEAVRLPVGEARLVTTISGDSVTNLERTVHVPEDWEREQTRNSAVRGAVMMASFLLYALLLLWVLVMSVVRWARHQLDARVVARIMVVMVPITLIGLVNSLPADQAGFDTAKPWGIQVMMSLGGALLLAVFGVAVGAAVVGSGLPAGGLTRSGVRRGAALGLVLAGLSAVVRLLSNSPPVGVPPHLDAAIPLLSVVTGPTVGFLVAATLVSLVLYTGGRINRQPLVVLWYLATGSVIAAAGLGAGLMASVGAWLAGTVGLLAVDRVGRAEGGAAILVALATWEVIGAGRDLLQAGPLAGWVGLAGATVLLVMLVRLLRPAEPAQA